MIAWKTAFALRMIDDYSGKCILKKKFQFKADGVVCHPVEKEEGIYVFLEPMGDRVHVEITGTDYYGGRVIVEKKNLDPAEPIADVRLCGKPGRDFPYRCALVTGRLASEEGEYPTWVYAKRPALPGLALKECRMIENENWLNFSGFTRESLVGKVFSLGSGEETDVFIIAEKRGINEYRIEGKLDFKHAPGTRLTRMYRSVTDEKGAYAIPVEMGDEAKISEVMTLQHKSSHHKGREEV